MFFSIKTPACSISIIKIVLSSSPFNEAVIDKVTSQVIIEARIVEIEEEYIKDLGFAWTADVGPFGLNGGKLAGTGDVSGSTGNYTLTLTDVTPDTDDQISEAVPLAVATP